MIIPGSKPPLSGVPDFKGRTDGCTHRRQSFNGRELPCAQSGCPGGGQDARAHTISIPILPHPDRGVLFMPGAAPESREVGEATFVRRHVGIDVVEGDAISILFNVEPGRYWAHLWERVS